MARGNRKPNDDGNGDGKPVDGSNGGAANPDSGNSAAPASDTGTGPIFDPAKFRGPGNDGNGNSDSAGSATFKRKRGRPAGSGTQKKTLDISGLEKILYANHLLLATLCGVPQIALTETEASQLGKASADVLRHYDIPGLDQKTVDWMNLIQCAGMIYGPRVFSYRADMAARKQAQQPGDGRTAPPQSAPVAVKPTTRKEFVEGIGEVEVPIN